MVNCDDLGAEREVADHAPPEPHQPLRLFKLRGHAGSRYCGTDSRSGRLPDDLTTLSMGDGVDTHYSPPRHLDEIRSRIEEKVRMRSARRNPRASKTAPGAPSATRLTRPGLQVAERVG